MYHMKNIIPHNSKISLPNCMYSVKNSNESSNICEVDINVGDQTSSTNMTELERRQDNLIKKLHILYERILTISSICSTNNIESSMKATRLQIPVPQEIVLNINLDTIPWYLNAFLKDNSIVTNVSWHIHSTVPNDKVDSIKAFVKNLHSSNKSKINFRLIFKCGVSDSELRYSSLAIPIVGNVNILRYFSLIYPTTVPYNLDDYNVDALIDLCHLLERASEKNKLAIVQELFAQYNTWIYNNMFSIVDLAAYSVIKQMKNKPKSVPKDWFERCYKICN